MKLSGAQILLECLRREKVTHIFGYPGGAVLPIYDAIFDCKDILHVLVRHEQGAAHMADGFARATGRVGVCLATSGPGATNLVTGLATAQMDSIPMVAITGQVRTAVIGKDAFQEADITGITMPITKHNFLVKRVEDLALAVAEAFHIASTGRPGPVLIDIPLDVSKALMEFDPENDYPERVNIPSYRPAGPHTRIPELQLRKAAQLIAEAQRPVLYVGGGAVASGAQAEVTALAERTNILVTTTLLGKGAIDETHPLSMGMLGMHGTAYANHAVNQSDLLIAVGARFDDRVTGDVSRFATGARIIHIDIDPAEIGKVVPADVPIVGDVKTILTELLKYVQPRPATAWNDTIMEWKRRFPLVYPRDGKLYAEYVIEQISEVFDHDCIMTTDVGQHQMWAAQYFKCRRPRQWITSGGLGTMGYGLPAAIGAQFACPDKRVVCLSGDGSFQMMTQELMTATVYGLPIVTVIINNKSLGMVRQWQEMFYAERYSAVDLEASPDFVKLAEAYGGIGMRIDRPEQVRDALTQAKEVRDRPVVIDCIIPTSENVYPMIPSGQSIEEMMIRKDLEQLKADVHADGSDWSFADQEKILEHYVEVMHNRE
ncbi:MAG: biosynthetic-type acetolactate synthase large subunit [Chloroherpetonaceae bacterium]|nr:biosynthetic-type acetolactate synthase large subunit [Chthonomonadaceae bacterium]MDW8207618.1 biosynthetic-type acetolactate synthase large subunit [Chloroherpetonaceae bacterium]